MISHDEVLARITQSWIDIIPSRRSLPKRSLPANADEPSPNVIVAALPADRTALEIRGQFRLKHRKPGFNPAHEPTDSAWQFLTPAGERLMLFTWVNWLRNSRKLFEEFCRETRREFGTLSPDGMISLAGKAIPLRDCRIVHEDELKPRPPVTVRPKSAKAITAVAEQLLKRRKSRLEELHTRVPFNDTEAHDEELQRTLEKTFRAAFAKYEQALCAACGPPAETGSEEHEEIPLNGLLQHAVWTIGGKRLYLALSHEETELPWIIAMGVKV